MTPGSRRASRKVALALSLAAAAGAARAQAAAGAGRPDAGTPILHELNRAMIRLADRVSPSVVQVQVTGYRPAGPGGGHAESALVARQHAVGSGVVVGSDGYVLTNHHVVRGALRIQVLVPLSRGGPPGSEEGGRRLLDARVVGADPDVDLAVLKVEAKGLRALSLDAAAPVRQGEMVFAIGSPEGLERTVTMGIVGSSERQIELGQAMAFIQTDAPINPGNSGGPLVNVEGQIVGINTFIVSESGGSQGLGFAIPAAMARIVYESLRRDGRVRSLDAGLALQAIDHPLAAGLGLPRDWGVVVADVAPGGAARAAGVRPGDVIVSLDGRPIDDLADVTTARYLHPPSDPIRMVLLRGTGRVALTIDAKERSRPPDLSELARGDTGLVRRLGIIGVDVSDKLRGVIPPLQVGSGVVVAARTLDATAAESGLEPGDVIHALNRTAIDSVEGLRQALRSIKVGDPVALQIERGGKMGYLSFEME
jgi:serine protease Do